MNNPIIHDSLSQEAIDKRLKVYVKFSPYFATDTQVEISTIEQVLVYHKKLGGSRILGELLKDKKVPKRKKRRVLKDVLKFWDKEYKEIAESQKKEMLEKTKKLKRKRIKKIGHFFIYLFALISIITLLLGSKKDFFKDLPLVKNYVINIYDLMQKSIYYNLIIFLTYLSLFSCLYLIVVKTYFDETRKIGGNAETFINTEFKKLNKKYHRQHGILKHHLFKYMKRRFYKKKYELNKIYDPKVVISKLEQYSKFIEEKVVKFRKSYFVIKFIGFLLKLSTLGLTGYLGYIYHITY